MCDILLIGVDFMFDPLKEFFNNNEVFKMGIWHKNGTHG